MLQLSQDQLDELGRQGLLQSLNDHWRRSLPRAVASLSPAEVKRLAVAAVHAAQREGITAERDLFTWSDLCLAARTSFAAHLPLASDGQHHGGR